MKPLERMHSYDAFRIFWMGWKLQGVYTVENLRFYHIIHMATIIITINITTSIMFIGQLFFVESFKELLGNLTMGLCLIICGYKYLIFLMMRRHLVRIRETWERLDVRPTTKLQREHMESICKRCNRLATLMFSSYMTVNALFVIHAGFSHRERLAFPVWVPYDWSNSAVLYWITWMYQGIAQFFFCVQQAGNDVTGPIFLYILKTHLKIIMGRIENISPDPNKSDWENCQELIDCIEDHRLIMDVFDVLQGTVSYTILFQFIGTAIVFCMNILLYFLYTLSLTEVLILMLFLFAEIVEILPCCYFSNEFMSSTDEFVTAIYSTDWTGQNPKFKKLMIIFMEMTQETKVIIAGKIIPVTLATFVSIMKISYSMFTVASQFQ
ncbi:odorant receptor 33a-like isoform X2 [Hermetia illucens]|uniref:odorant receptor 33a-like isoform X2 n=1 Tax=Hermetia illucens TaxID=343691 RepID=UPI0018CC3EC5|nr:odorant receptor 33a-like isoform X2 [Hermetia illucens]